MEKERIDHYHASLCNKLSGRPMEDWFTVLDTHGAKELKHAAIFSLVSSTDGLKPLGQWNQNLLTTTYEWEQGIEAKRPERESVLKSASAKQYC